MKRKNPIQRELTRLQSGFSLLEMLITIAILGTVLGGIFSQLNVAVQRQSTERFKLDDIQEARDFVDQFFRDINEIGYPNVRMFDNTTNWLVNPLINDNRLAVGLVKMDANEVRFEGDTNGDGNVQSVIYMINGSGTCTLCLQRSQVTKVVGNPLTGQPPNWGTEVNDVASSPIFTFYDKNANQLAVPADINSNPNIIASVKVIKISLLIRNPNVKDLQSKLPIETAFEGEVSLNNCSMAATGQGMSC
jgi:prepilin-type N-terminal cleavage/methylation domain-containing protein